jgi:hypothetical protein
MEAKVGTFTIEEISLFSSIAQSFNLTLQLETEEYFLKKNGICFNMFL